MKNNKYTHFGGEIYAKKKKVNWWLIIVLGIIAVLCAGYADGVYNSLGL